MIAKGKSTIELLGDTGILVTRHFAAKREMVFDALRKPELLQKWLLGPDGWTMPECEIDLRVGGKVRFYWSNGQGRELQMSGIVTEVNAPVGFSVTQRFDLGYIGPEEKLRYILEEDGDETLIKVELIYPSQEMRDGALKSGMTDGMERSYERMDDVLTA